VSKHSHLLPALDLIEAFGFWLKRSEPGWSISRPAVERTLDGEQHPIFVLYQDGVSLGTYRTPTEALARIGNERLTREFESLVAGTGTDTQEDS
jgi:hypothetical protein